MTIPPTVRDTPYAHIYRAVLNARRLEVVSFDNLTTREILKITANLRGHAMHETYGKGVKVRTRSQIMKDGSGKKILYIEKVMK